MNKELKLKLIKARESVKRKFDAIKSNRLESQQHLEESYKPLTKKLHEIITSNKPEIIIPIKKEMKKESTPRTVKSHSSVIKENPNFFQPDFSDIQTQQQQQLTSVNLQPSQLPQPSTLEDDEVFSINASPEESFEMPRTPSPIAEESIIQYIEQFGPLPKQYIGEKIRDTENKFDDGIQGVRHETNDKYFIGNSEIKFNSKDSDFEINGIRYIGTPGLYELLFKKTPIGYNSDDQKQYADIIKRTAAVQIDHDPNRRVAGNRSDKYKNIIAPLIGKTKLPTTTSARPRLGSMPTRLGRGYMSYNTRPAEYVHWDDPNELVDRLRLLLSSQQAGNNSHTNEIQSIIEELREAKIIL